MSYFKTGFTIVQNLYRLTLVVQTNYRNKNINATKGID